LLLAQLGAHATGRFAGRLAELGLVPAHAGILNALADSPGMSQCALAKLLGMLPSRMVAYVDELEGRGLLQRRPHRSDRRNNALHLTEAGRAAVHCISRLVQENQQALLAPLSKEQRVQLADLLQLIARAQSDEQPTILSGELLQAAKRVRPLLDGNPVCRHTGASKIRRQ
jgi:DNA-binding MarR family transcriptional regulator